MSQTCKILFLLDLDHTVIYGSFAPTESATKLFQYHQYLAVYERPFARELIRQCNNQGDIIVYTTALRRYAKRICNDLTIQPLELLSRKNCPVIHGAHTKTLRPEWIANYEQLIIIDDSPNVWRNIPSEVLFWVPTEFRGDQNDTGLLPILNQFETLNHKSNTH